MDISEVSGLMYKTYLEDLESSHGEGSVEYSEKLPDFKKWELVFPEMTQQEIMTRFFDTDDFALVPIIAISYEQAVAFCDWRTQQFKKELSKMSAEDRAQFPQDFRFRLPTAKEWARIRFMTQPKGVAKNIQKITAGTAKAYKLKKNTLLHENPKLSHIYTEIDGKLAMYNLFNNVAEMTAEKGVAMGGSWQKGNETKRFDQKFSYEEAQAWLGFRCIFEILK
ncbi:MAG: hypothetical protein Roseis2KO_47120 [Roseivirga sp.]